ncbi:NAD(P)H dehydrogenase (quinone) [Octadecabacter temperatus]|uniref:General stress protein 14 n=1 Tax=Octadecabacter temperatus TaxID=1458307 RepID=A0A0K0Y836_9RHOB|nr:NAD(P)H-dependent oxidoreductase [Octadecabacter temperatus]AKS47075.1 General stress protein 14 [Octadecabacter temperatus]SIO46785.1 NAD(P)H dehydrogenase (quinone) [Octadecabacter temperatus]
MTHTLIITAHPSRGSFTNSWAKKTEQACLQAGGTVSRSDLVQMNFDPVERFEHYPDHTGSDVLKCQEEASERGTLPTEIEAEIAKFRAADRIILHFPIWWFGPPAIIKGWCERVLANGAMHTASERFDAGRYRDKTVLFCTSTGSGESESSPDGKEGDVRMLLWPLAYTFRYLGCNVAQPQVIHGVHGYWKDHEKQQTEARLADRLSAHAGIIDGFDELPLMQFNEDSNFDEDGRLRADAQSVTAFITHI